MGADGQVFCREVVGTFPATHDDLRAEFEGGAVDGQSGTYRRSVWHLALGECRGDALCVDDLDAVDVPFRPLGVGVKVDDLGNRQRRACLFRRAWTHCLPDDGRRGVDDDGVRYVPRSHGSVETRMLYLRRFCAEREGEEQADHSQSLIHSFILFVRGCVRMSQ